MKDITPIYLGRIVSKKNFRTYVYAPDGSQKLVESWEEFEREMESGLWFISQEDAQKNVPAPSPKPRKVKKEKVAVLGEIQKDDFLPVSE